MALKPLKPSKQKRKDKKHSVPALLQPKPEQEVPSRERLFRSSGMLISPRLD